MTFTSFDPWTRTSFSICPLKSQRAQRGSKIAEVQISSQTLKFDKSPSPIVFFFQPPLNYDIDIHLRPLPPLKFVFEDSARRHDICPGRDSDIFLGCWSVEIIGQFNTALSIAGAVLGRRQSFILWIWGGWDRRFKRFLRHLEIGDKIDHYKLFLKHN